MEDLEFSIEWHGGLLIGVRTYDWDDAQRIAFYLPFIGFWVTIYD